MLLAVCGLAYPLPPTAPCVAHTTGTVPESLFTSHHSGLRRAPRSHRRHVNMRMRVLVSLCACWPLLTHLRCPHTALTECTTACKTRLACSKVRDRHSAAAGARPCRRWWVGAFHFCWHRQHDHGSTIGLGVGCACCIRPQPQRGSSTVAAVGVVSLSRRGRRRSRARTDRSATAIRGACDVRVISCLSPFQ